MKSWMKIMMMTTRRLLLEIDCNHKRRAEATKKHLKKGCFVEVRTDQHAVLFGKLKQARNGGYL